MKPTLFVDLDGTLLDVQARHHAVYAEAARELGLEPRSRADYWQVRRSGGGSVDALGDVRQDLRDRFSAIWMERIELEENLVLDRLYPGAVSALEELSGPFRLVLITLRRKRGGLAGQLQRLGIAEGFDEVLSVTDQSRSRKTQMIGQFSGPAVVLGDGEADVEFAREIGARCVSVGWGMRSAECLRAAGAREIVSSFSEMTAALSRSQPVGQASP